MQATIPYELFVWNQWTLAGVMLIAGLAKLADQDEFIQAVINYKVLPRRTSRVLARFVPWLEMFSAVLLASTRFVKIGGLLGSILLAGFTCAVVYNLIRGRTINCGCMGKITSDRIGFPLIARNTILLISIWLIMMVDMAATYIPARDWVMLIVLIILSVILLTFFGAVADFLNEAFFRQRRKVH